MSETRQASDLPLRTASGLVAIVVALACLWFGGLAWWLMVSVLSVAMLREWCALVGVRGWRMALALTVLVALLLLLLAGEFGHPLVVGLGGEAVAVTPATFLGPLAVLLILTVAASAVTVSGRIGWGLLYVGLPAVSLLFLRTGGGGLFGNAAGFVATLLTLATVWATDIGAYFAGRTIGGAKLAPTLSPNKTWAGLIGGMILAAVVVIVLTFAIEQSGPHEGGGINLRALVMLATIGGLGAILAQAGDLFESWLKRRVGVKDSGRFLPGHGGALDRLDGLVPVSVAAALLVFLGHG